MSGRGRAGLVIALCLALIAATVLVVVRVVDGTEVRADDGGVAALPGGQLSVDLGATGAGTDVELSTGLIEGPPPAPVVRPLSRVFEVSPSLDGASGVVTFRVGSLPAGVDPALVVMYVEQAEGWAPVPTDYDPRSGQVSGRWPHFSRGFVGIVDPVFDAVGDGAQWTWDRAGDAASWSRDRAEDLRKLATDASLALLGGSADRAECEPNAAEWTFEGAAEGVLPSALSGCAKPRAGDGWPVTVANSAPFPYLLTLPDGVDGLGALAALTSQDAEDAVVSLIWSTKGKTVVPSGDTTELSFGADVASQTRIDAITDPSTMAVEAVAILITVASRGYSSAVRKELRDAIDDVKSRNPAGARSAKDFEVELRQLLAERRSTDRTRNQFVMAQAFNVLDGVNCAVELSTGDTIDDFGDAFKKAFEDCYSPLVESMARELAKEAGSLVDPRRQQKEQAALVKGLLADALEIRQFMTVQAAGQAAVVTLGQANYLSGRLDARCSGPPCPVVVPLGRAGEFTQGFGSPRPSVIDLGGASSLGLVTDVSWSSWGGETAEGTGTAGYVAPGLANAAAQRVQAQILAFDLGDCGGRTAYRQVSWWFPQYGETRDGTAALDACDRQ